MQNILNDRKVNRVLCCLTTKKETILIFLCPTGLHSLLFPTGVSRNAVLGDFGVCVYVCMFVTVLHGLYYCVYVVSFHLSCSPLRLKHFLSVSVSGDVSGGFRCGEDLSARPLQRWSLSSRELHLHCGHRLQGECTHTLTYTHTPEKSVLNFKME